MSCGLRRKISVTAGLSTSTTRGGGSPAQLDTLRTHGLRHAILGASGCGAFRNPAGAVARNYQEELEIRERDFSLVAFAIHASGYGPDDYGSFASMFGTNPQR
jgi:hypothetical protein